MAQPPLLEKEGNGLVARPRQVERNALRGDGPGTGVQNIFPTKMSVNPVGTFDI